MNNNINSDTKGKMKRNVLLLGLVSFLDDFSSEMIMPILPMFITNLGGSALAVGLIGGLRDSISSILKVLCGYWSDKTGMRKIFVFSGYLTSGIFKLLLSFSGIWQHVLVFGSLERVGKGLRTAPRDAIIADSMPYHRGRGFGMHRAFDTAGAVLGTALVFILFWFLKSGFKTIILTAAIIASLSLIPLYFVKDGKRNPQNITLRLGIKTLPKTLKLFILVSGIFGMANFSYMFFVLRAKEYFSGRLSVAAPILLYILFNIFYALFSIPFGNLSDRIGRKKVLILGYTFFSLTSFGLAFCNSLVAFIILFALYGTVYAMIDGNQRAYVSDLAQGGLKAVALGTFHTVIGLVALPASLMAGLLWQVFGYYAVFIYGGLMSVLAVIFFVVAARRP